MTISDLIRSNIKQISDSRKAAKDMKGHQRYFELGKQVTLRQENDNLKKLKEDQARKRKNFLRSY